MESSSRASLLLLWVLIVTTAFTEVTGQSPSNTCGGLHQFKKHKMGIKMNYTLYGDMSKRPVLIINTLSRGAREWDEFAGKLCESNKFSIVLVHTPVIEKMKYWKILLMLKKARAAMSSPDPVILFAKRTGAIYAIKYAIHVGFQNVSKMGLVSPNVTDMGDLWTLKHLKGRLVLFWNVEDRAVDYFVSAAMWETTIMPPMITVRDSQKPLSQQLLQSMLKFSDSEPIMAANYSLILDGDQIDPVTEDITVYE